MRASGSLTSRILPPVLVLAGVLVIWDLYVRVTHTPDFLLPMPTAVIRSLFTDRRLLSSLGWTALAALSGFVASGVFGVLIAIALSASPILRRAFFPYTLFFQTVPI